MARFISVLFLSCVLFTIKNTQGMKKKGSRGKPKVYRGKQPKDSSKTHEANAGENIADTQAMINALLKKQEELIVLEKHLKATNEKISSNSFISVGKSNPENIKFFNSMGFVNNLKAHPDGTHFNLYVATTSDKGGHIQEFTGGGFTYHFPHGQKHKIDHILTYKLREMHRCFNEAIFELVDKLKQLKQLQQGPQEMRQPQNDQSSKRKKRKVTSEVEWLNIYEEMERKVRREKFEEKLREEAMEVEKLRKEAVEAEKLRKEAVEAEKLQKEKLKESMKAEQLRKEMEAENLRNEAVEAKILEEGTVVEITGLKSDTVKELNGKSGTIRKYLKKRDRYEVVIPDRKKSVSVKKENLKEVTSKHDYSTHSDGGVATATATILAKEEVSPTFAEAAHKVVTDAEATEATEEEKQAMAKAISLELLQRWKKIKTISPGVWEEGSEIYFIMLKRLKADLEEFIGLTKTIENADHVTPEPDLTGKTDDQQWVQQMEFVPSESYKILVHLESVSDDIATSLVAEPEHEPEHMEDMGEVSVSNLWIILIQATRNLSMSHPKYFKEEYLREKGLGVNIWSLFVDSYAEHLDKDLYQYIMNQREMFWRQSIELIFILKHNCPSIAYANAADNWLQELLTDFEFYLFETWKHYDIGLLYTSHNFTVQRQKKEFAISIMRFYYFLLEIGENAHSIAGTREEGEKLMQVIRLKFGGWFAEIYRRGDIMYDFLFSANLDDAYLYPDAALTNSVLGNVIEDEFFMKELLGIPTFERHWEFWGDAIVGRFSDDDLHFRRPPKPVEVTNLEDATRLVGQFLRIENFSPDFEYNANFVYENGTEVTVIGLCSTQGKRLNGKSATIVKYDEVAERYQVVHKGKRMDVKHENLKLKAGYASFNERIAEVVSVSDVNGDISFVLEYVVGMRGFKKQTATIRIGKNNLSLIGNGQYSTNDVAFMKHFLHTFEVLKQLRRSYEELNKLNPSYGINHLRSFDDGSELNIGHIFKISRSHGNTVTITAPDIPSLLAHDPNLSNNRFTKKLLQRSKNVHQKENILQIIQSDRNLKANPLLPDGLTPEIDAKLQEIIDVVHAFLEFQQNAKETKSDTVTIDMTQDMTVMFPEETDRLQQLIQTYRSDVVLKYGTVITPDGKLDNSVADKSDPRYKPNPWAYPQSKDGKEMRKELPSAVLNKYRDIIFKFNALLESVIKIVEADEGKPVYERSSKIRRDVEFSNGEKFGNLFKLLGQLKCGFAIFSTNLLRAAQYHDIHLDWLGLKRRDGSQVRSLGSQAQTDDSESASLPEDRSVDSSATMSSSVGMSNTGNLRSKTTKKKKKKK